MRVKRLSLFTISWDKILLITAREEASYQDWCEVLQVAPDGINARQLARMREVLH